MCVLMVWVQKTTTLNHNGHGCVYIYVYIYRNGITSNEIMSNRFLIDNLFFNSIVSIDVFAPMHLECSFLENYTLNLI